jgi:hypothetical protein
VAKAASPSMPMSWKTLVLTRNLAGRIHRPRYMTCLVTFGWLFCSSVWAAAVVLKGCCRQLLMGAALQGPLRAEQAGNWRNMRTRLLQVEVMVTAADVIRAEPVQYDSARVRSKTIKMPMTCQPSKQPSNRGQGGTPCALPEVR